MMSWIKIREDLKDDPAVLRMASTLRMDVWGVIGRLSDIWAWVGRHTATGENVGLDDEMIDLRVRKPGFAAAMRKAEWLGGKKGALHFPNWERHNAQSTKARLLESEARNRRRSDGQSPDENRTLSGSRPDNVRKKADQEKKRREKKKGEEKRAEKKKAEERKNPPAPPPPAPAPSSAQAASAAPELPPTPAPTTTDAPTAARPADAAPPPQVCGGASASADAQTPETHGSVSMSVRGLADPEPARSERASRPGKSRGTLEEVKEFCLSLGLPLNDAEHCYHKWQGNGWTNGAKAIQCWRSTIRSWMASGYLPRRVAPQGPPLAGRIGVGAGAWHRGPAPVPSRTYQITGGGPQSWDASSDGPPPELPSAVTVAASQASSASVPMAACES